MPSLGSCFDGVGPVQLGSGASLIVLDQKVVGLFVASEDRKAYRLFGSSTIFSEELMASFLVFIRLWIANFVPLLSSIATW